MNVAYVMTRNVYDWAVPSIKSLRHYNPDAKVYVLCEDDEYPLADVTINVNKLNFFRKDGPNYNNSFTYINLYRPMYAQFLPCDRVIHMDIDTIVCDTLQLLYDTDLTGKWYGMVQEYKGGYRPYGPAYYNAGVMVYNLQQMRQDNILELFRLTLDQAYMTFPDQDILNQYVEKIVPVDVRYNENNFTGETDNPAVVHYAGVRKWWTEKGHRHEYLEKWRPPNNA